jgi:hypothetical protein
MQSTSAAPLTQLLGIQDLSKRAVAVPPEAAPSHCPLTFFFAQKGPTSRQLLSGAGAVLMYGSASFDLTQPYATHTTAAANEFFAQANAQTMKRLVPADAPLKANRALWLDVLATPVPVYQRGSDGGYLLDNLTGLPIPATPAATTVGYICKWVLTTVNTGLATGADSTYFGQLTQTVGDQTDTANAHSVRIPILEFWADSFGSAGNNTGLRMWAPQAGDDTPVSSQVLSRGKFYPFRLAAITRADASSTATIKSLISGDTSLEFTFKPGTRNPYTNGQMSLGDVFDAAWSSRNKPGFVDQYADISGLHIYQDNINTLMAQFYASESTAIGQTAKPGSDFTPGATDELWKVNFINALSSTGKPYYSVQMNTLDPNAVVLTESTNLWAQSGGDGTMNETVLSQLVITEMAAYLDPNSPLMDLAANCETALYDSGFTLAAKEALCNFIAVRKDTMVFLSPYDTTGPQQSNTDEAAAGLSLLAKVSLFPESTYFGTPVCRAVIMAANGKFLPSLYAGNLPVVLELGSKMAGLMGASNGKWNAVNKFDGAPGSILTKFANLNETYVPPTQLTTDWANGLNHPQRYSRSQWYLPAVKTVYNDDTSVINNIFAVAACCQLERIGVAAHREFSGNQSKKDAQFIKAVNSFCNDQIVGKFAGMFDITPDCQITDYDAQLGYKWTLGMDLKGQTARTVETLYITVSRQAATTASAN